MKTLHLCRNESEARFLFRELCQLAVGIIRGSVLQIEYTDGSTLQVYGNPDLHEIFAKFKGQYFDQVIADSRMDINSVRLMHTNLLRRGDDSRG